MAQFENKNFSNQDYLNNLKKANESLGISDDLSVLNNRNIIFIYTPPKVGSTTLVSSIRLNACGKFTVLHLHNELMLRLLYKIYNLTILEIIKYNNFLGKKVYVIDIYRSPIEQKLSTFFENIDTFHFNTPIESLKNVNINKIIKRFNRVFPYLAVNDYFREKYEIDCPESFDFNKKYLVVEKNDITYYKLRLTDSCNWKSILYSIFGIEMFIMNDYETEKKPIHELYKTFKQYYNIPINLFNMIEEDKNLLFYYSTEERNTYLNLWRNKIGEIVEPFTSSEYKLYNNISSDNQYLNEIHQNHYLDRGCLCQGCCRKRGKILVRLRNGEHVDTRIVHSEATHEYLVEKAKKMNIFTPVNKNNLFGRQHIRFKFGL
jgi:hypothetical protein